MSNKRKPQAEKPAKAGRGPGRKKQPKRSTTVAEAPGADVPPEIPPPSISIDPEVGGRSDDPRIPRSGPREKDRKAAAEVLKDPASAKNFADETEVKANFFKKFLGPVWADLCTMIRLVKAYASGDYREIPWRTLVMIVGALVYFLSPFDLIADFIPALGMVDDAAVLGWTARMAHSDLEAFRRWERRRSLDAPKS